MVLALEPSHKICALTPGIPEVAGSDGKAKRRAGLVPGAVDAPIKLAMGLSSRLPCRNFTRN